MVKIQNSLSEKKPVRIMNKAGGGGGGGGRRIIAVESNSRGNGGSGRRNGGGNGGGNDRAAARAAGRARAAAAAAADDSDNGYEDADAGDDDDDNDNGMGGGGGGGRRGGNKVVEYDGRMVWVNAESTAGSVSHSIVGAALPGARVGFPVYVFAKYDKNANVAIKGVVSAQRILIDRYNLCVAVSPCFRANRNELTLMCSPLEGASEPPHVANARFLDGVQQLTVASSTDYKVLAGAIAAEARAGKASSLQAIGAKAVFEMLRAVSVARDYLASDNEGQDLVCFPDFVLVGAAAAAASSIS